MTDNPPPTVIDRRGMGGITAIDGFDYQLWDLLIRVPAWLANPAFEELVYEGLEDYEARFFAPQSSNGSVLDRFQSKASPLTPAEVRGVFEGFQEFEVAFPRSARVQTLVMPSLPPTLNWMARDTDRVRKARPFYAPFPKIVEAGDAALRQNFAESYPGGLGEFVAASVEVDERVLPSENTAVHAFASELARVFPELDPSHSKVKAAFDALAVLVRRAVGAPVGRDALRLRIEEALKQQLSIPSVFPLGIRSDRTGRDEKSLEIDASSFSGGDPGYPAREQWAVNLVGPLQATSAWLRRHNVGRVAPSGMYRLTTAMVIGWCLRSAVGFELEIPTKEGSWATDDRPLSGAGLPTWHITHPSQLVGDRLIVSIGVFRDPAADLPSLINVPREAILALHLSEAIPSAKAAQAVVEQIKRTVVERVVALKAKGIDLYFAGPAALAVALGHRWNAMPPTQLHEFLNSSQTYVATALI